MLEEASTNSSDIMPVNVKVMARQERRKKKAKDKSSDKPTLKRIRPLITPVLILVALTPTVGGEKTPSVEKETPPTELVGLVVAQSTALLDVPIGVEGPSKLSKSKKPVKKNASESKKFSPSFTYKGKLITADQSAFQSCVVAFNLFTQATLPKDEETLHQMSDHDLKKDGFRSLLKVCYHTV